jgi:hypothetical protein
MPDERAAAHSRLPDTRATRGVAAAVAALFGLATVIAGTRVLSGADPGYVVFRPLLVFNTAMGIAYLAAALAIWQSLRLGTAAAAAIAVLNLVFLIAICGLYLAGRSVAIDSVWAMTLRAAVWLGLFLALVWVGRR